MKILKSNEFGHYTIRYWGRIRARGTDLWGAVALAVGAAYWDLVDGCDYSEVAVRTGSLYTE